MRKAGSLGTHAILYWMLRNPLFSNFYRYRFRLPNKMDKIRKAIPFKENHRQHLSRTIQKKAQELGKVRFSQFVSNLDEVKSRTLSQSGVAEVLKSAITLELLPGQFEFLRSYQKDEFIKKSRDYLKLVIQELLRKLSFLYLFIF